MDLGLTGKSLQSALIEYTVRLQLSDVYFIVIESPFDLESCGGRISLSPDRDPAEAFQPIRELVGRTVDEATTDGAGALRVRFSGGTLLTVPADEEYEAWSVSGPNGALVVCTAGGKLVTWTARPKS